MGFHLIHNIDFIPISNWDTNVGAALFQISLRLRTFLADTGHLEAKVAIDHGSLETSCAKAGVSLREILSGTAEGMAEKRAASTAFAEERSAKIGHSLNFSFEYSTDQPS